MDVSDAVAHVQAALSEATRDMPAKEYLKVLDELVDDFETRHSVAIEETGDRAHLLFNDLCNQNLIPEGEYLVNVCW